MKTYLKLLVAGASIFAASVYAQDEGNSSQPTNQPTNEQSDALSTVESATNAIVASVAVDDKEATLTLLAAACAKFPESAAAFVTALINAISAANANSPVISASNVALGGKPGDVNAAVVGEIVATAIEAAPNFSDAIIAAAKAAAPNAVGQIDVSSASPLIFLGQEVLGGNTFDPSTFTNPSSNNPGKDAS